VEVKPRTVGARDALFRTAVDAVVAACLDPTQSSLDLAGLPAPRFLASVAHDVGVPADKGTGVVAAAVAAAVRARLLDVSASGFDCVCGCVLMVAVD
jgi:hypothetical protein